MSEDRVAQADQFPSQDQGGTAIEVDVPAAEIVPGMTAVPVGPGDQDQVTTGLAGTAPLEGTGALPGAVQSVPAHPADAVVATGDHFDVVIRGYERRQVDDYVARVSTALDQLRAQATAAGDRAAWTEAELARVRSELERGRPSFDALGERVAQMLGLAETESEQMRRDASRDAAQLRSDAQQDAAAVREQAAREAEQLGAAARRELADLNEQRITLLTELARMRDTVNHILADAGEQWPSLAPAAGAEPIDLTGTEPAQRPVQPGTS